MKRTFLPLFLLSAAVAIPAAAAESSRYIIAMKHGVTARRVLMPLRNARAMDALDFVAADLTADEVATLRASSNVRYVSAVVPRSLSRSAAPRLAAAPAASPYASAQTVPWGIDKIHARDVWPAGRGAAINVAVLDTGIDKTHPDLGPAVAGGYDTFAKANFALDDNGHGTHVAGTVAARDNGFGVVGVAPEAKLWAVKVLDANGDGDDETVVAGLTKVLEWKRAVGGNWIVSLSLGAIDPSDPEREAFQKVADEGILAIAAAGNRGMPELDYPAGYPTVLAVGAIDVNDREPNFSSWGTNLGVVAPGVSVLSSLPRGTSTIAAAQIDGANPIGGFLFTGPPHGEVRATLVNCGYGAPEEIPASVRGNIALMSRGENIAFADKVRNAVAAGAVGAIVYNSDASDPKNWTLIRQDCTDPNACVPWSEDVNFPWPVTVALRRDDGLALVAQAGKPVTIGVWQDDYGYLSGTSMATPHVSGMAALIWSTAPTAAASQVRLAILASARDLGDPGYDPIFGYGAADALAASKILTAPPPKHRGALH